MDFRHFCAFNTKRQRQGWLIPSLALTLCTLGSWTQRAQAEGSADLIVNGGNRPVLEYIQTAPPGQESLAGIPRRSVISVYAAAGETINLGSSAVGIGQGTINYTDPTGNVGSCGATGNIANLGQEVVGPLPNPGGYNPCVINVTAATTGVWQIEFVSPQSNFTVNPPNPNPIAATAAWTQPNNVGYVVAWDATVRNANGAAILGRTYANFLALNLGGNGLSLNSETYVQTIDGYLYRVNLNGIDPFRFIFFANTQGFEDATGNPLFRSVQLTPTEPPNLPPGISFYNPFPARPDVSSSGDATHKIFFNLPNNDLPPTANITPVAGGSTWLRPGPVAPPTVSTFEFTGIEGTPRQTGTAPLGGNFTFTSSNFGSYQIILDLNEDGIYGNGNDRILVGAAVSGLNTVFWNGLDENGVPVPAGLTAYGAQIILTAGEAHFPFIDPENNPNGIIVERLTVPGPDSFVIHYDDRLIPNDPTSLCNRTETRATGGGPENNCYGTSIDPRSALVGVDSSTGGHAFSGGNNFREGFGDVRGIDSWVFFPSSPFIVEDIIRVAEADLSITKTANTTSVAPGAPITYTITVTNNGPSNVEGATVNDLTTDQLTGVTWTCTASAGSSCPASGTGSISTTVNLLNGGTATFTLNGTLSPSVSGSLLNTVTVLRPNDVTDPNDPNRTGAGNNTATSTVTLTNQPQAFKSVRFIRDNDNTGTLTVGDDIQYTINVRNPSATTAIENLVVSDIIPTQSQVLRDASNPITVDSGFSVASTLPSTSFEGTGTPVALTNPGTLAPGALLTLTFNVRIRQGAASPVTNQSLINFSGDAGNPVRTDASDSNNPTAPGSNINPGNPSDLSTGGNVNQPNIGTADPTIVNIVSPVSPTGTKSVRLVTDADASGSVTTGDTLEYTVTYTNRQPAALVSGFLATDTINPNQVSFVNGSYRFTAVNGFGATNTTTSVTANPSFNGTTDINLTNPTNRGELGANGGQVVISFRVLVNASSGEQITNQARATSNGGSVNLSVTDTLSGFGDLPQAVDDTIDQGNLPDPGDDDPTVVTVGTGGNPRLRLVKRITNVTRDGVPLNGINFGSFVDDPTDPNDTAPGWSGLSPVGIRQLGSEATLQSGDEVEYTIYFLSDGASPATGVRVCDAIPVGTTFLPDSFGAGSGILLNQSGTQTPQTNATDTDKGTFFSPLSPVTAPCGDTNNPNGSVLLQVGDIPNTAPNNLGFVRFRTRIE